MEDDQERLISPILEADEEDDRDMVAIANSASPPPASIAESHNTDEAMAYMVDIPRGTPTKNFSIAKLCAFAGPGFLMSIAYLDPGNIESDLQSGAIARYKLLWVLLSAHIIGFVLQSLSSRLGVVSGRHMAEIARAVYPKVPRIALWLMIEIAIAGSDMQEVIGTSVAIYMLSKGRVPLIVGVLITIVDTLTFMLIDRFGVRKLEGFFAFLIAVMAIVFGWEFVRARPDFGALFEGMFVPRCPDCGRREFLQGVSVVGAVIMPHNLYLHSALVRSRRIDRTQKSNVAEANLYFSIESAIALFCSFFINVFVVGVFAHGLYNKTNAEVRAMCDGRSDVFDASIFPNNTELVEADLYKGGVFLGCEFGAIALYIWGVGILASGQSSTMCGTYAGQYVMEGFLKIRWPRWRRVLVTRLIAIGPTLCVTLFANGISSLTGLNDLLNCVQMIMLPFALLPVVAFTSSKQIMFEFSNSRRFQAFALSISFAVIGINLWFAIDYIHAQFGFSPLVFVAMAVPFAFYIFFIGYLLVTSLVAMELIKASWLRLNVNINADISPWQVGAGADSSANYGSSVVVSGGAAS